MAKQVFTNVRYFVGPADLTAQTNKVELSWSAEDKETTNYASGGKKERIAGLEDVAISAEGQYEAGNAGYADDEWWNARGVVEAHTVGPHTANVAAVAYLTEAVRLEGKLFGNVGDVAMFGLAAAGNAGLGIGQFAQAPGTPITANGTGTGIQLPAVAATQRLFASLHLLSISGSSTPTLAVKIQSDDNGSFTSATDQLTFTTRSTIGSELLRTSIGAITDTYYRASFTVTGGTPSFLAIVAVGIG